MIRPSALACALAVLAFPTPASALPQSATLLVDLDPNPSLFDGEVSVGGTAHGLLWMSARTGGGLEEPRTSLFSLAPGSSQAVDLLPSNGLEELPGPTLREVIELPNGRIAFVFGGGSAWLSVPNSTFLVLSDGTEAGTFVQGGVQRSVRRLGDRVFFIGGGIAPPTELQSTDGTPGGTQVFEDLSPGPGSTTFQGPDYLGVTATHLFFQAFPATSGVIELRSIALGATSSTVIATTPFGAAFTSVELGGELLFAWNAGTGVGRELYASDGTAAGTRLVADIGAGPWSSDPWALGAGPTVAYFSADDSVSGVELWRTDGQTASRVVDLNAGPPDGVFNTPGTSAMLGDSLFFRGSDGLSALGEAWISDGTAGGTQALTSATGTGGNPFVLAAKTIGDRVYFVFNAGMGASEMYITDGTAIGTRPLGAPTQVKGTSVAEFAGRAWFGATAGPAFAPEQELWSSDGSPAGTALAVNVGQIDQNASSEPNAFRAGPGVVWFRAYVQGDVRLFKSDGTAGGTREVVAAGAAGVLLHPLATLGSGLVYGRQDAAAGETGFGEPWFSNGISGQEVPLGDLAPGIEGSLSAASSLAGSTAVLGDRLFFFANDGQGLDLWSTNGTAAGTGPIGAVSAGVVDGQVRPLEIVGDRVAFAADINATETGLWFTDGTAAGTLRISPPEFGPTPSFLEIESVDGELFAILDYFFGLDRQLWATDGSVAGTRLLGSFNDTTQGTLRAAGSNLIVAESKGLTAVDPSGATQTLLSLSNGTLAAFVQFPQASELAYYRVDGSPGDPETGLWATDGTPAGTLRVDGDPSSDLLAAPFGSDGSIVFSRTEPGSGSEAWISDGTVAGTGLLVDALAGPNGSAPVLVASARVGDRVLFSAMDDVAGTELHSLSISAAGGYVAEGYGLGCGIAASPQLTLGGEPRLGELVSLDVEGAAALAPVLHFVGLQADLLPIGNCSVLLSQPTLLVTGQTNGAGSSSLPFQLSTNPLWVGRSVYLQAAIGAAGGPLLSSLELTSALELVFGG